MCKWLESQKSACYERKQKLKVFPIRHTIIQLKILYLEFFFFFLNHLLQKWLAYLKTFKRMYLFLENNNGVGSQISDLSIVNVGS